MKTQGTGIAQIVFHGKCELLLETSLNSRGDAYVSPFSEGEFVREGAKRVSASISSITAKERSD
jgi:hypothetical protein